MTNSAVCWNNGTELSAAVGHMLTLMVTRCFPKGQFASPSILSLPLSFFPSRVCEDKSSGIVCWSKHVGRAYWQMDHQIPQTFVPSIICLKKKWSLELFLLQFFLWPHHIQITFPTSDQVTADVHFKGEKVLVAVTLTFSNSFSVWLNWKLTQMLDRQFAAPSWILKCRSQHYTRNHASYTWL